MSQRRPTTAVIAALLLSPACLLAESGECGEDSDPKEHACLLLAARAARGGGTSPHAADGGAAASDAAGRTGDAGPPQGLVCEPLYSGSGGSFLLSGASRTAGSCGGAGPESFHLFTAWQTGSFVFATDSPVDTVLYVRDGACDGVELGCDDDGGGSGGNSRVTVRLTQGQTVVVVVDTYDSSAAGSYRLLIEG